MSAENGFKDRLRAAAREAGMSQTTLASFASGATQTIVSLWMRGKATPTPTQRNELAVGLGVRIEWLSDGSGPVKAAAIAATPTAVPASADIPAGSGAAVSRSGAVARPREPVDETPAVEAEIGWDFRPAPKDGGKDFGNSNVWSFNPGLDVLVREVLQNAMDAAVSKEQRVDVVFRIITLSGDDFARFMRALEWKSDLEPHLRAASVGDQRFNTLLRDGLGRVEKELRLLVIEDSGTVGLTGPERDTGNFVALCRDNLHSHKASGGAGGAYGLGKAVLWRASRLFTVLFGSTLSEPQGGRSVNRVFGRSDLAWHASGGTSFAGPGWFGHRSVDGTTESVWENRALSDEVFVGRESAGTTACVVGFHDASADHDDDPEKLAESLAQASAENFFPALVANQLSVRVEVYDTGRQCHERKPSFERVVRPEEFMPASVAMLRAFKEGNVVQNLGDEPGAVAMRHVELVVPKRLDAPKVAELSHDAILLVMAATEDRGVPMSSGEPRSHLSMFRRPGMVVQSKSLAGLCLGARPFHALLLCGHAAGVAARDRPRSNADADLAAEMFLRAAEPPSHNQWTSTPDLSSIYARGCKARLEGFLRDAATVVRELIKPPPRDTGDGPNALKELFRIRTEPASFSERPTVRCTGEPDSEGRWDVKAVVRIKAKKTAQRLTPSVYFLTESGGGVAVKWASLSAERNCDVDGHDLIVPPDTREIRFSGTTDPSSHPVPAAHSCVSVEIRRLVSAGGGVQ